MGEIESAAAMRVVAVEVVVAAARACASLTGFTVIDCDSSAAPRPVTGSMFSPILAFDEDDDLLLAPPPLLTIASRSRCMPAASMEPGGASRYKSP